MSIRMSKQLRDHCGTLYGRIRVKVLSMIETEAGNADVEGNEKNEERDRSGLGDDCDCKSHRDKDKVVDFKNTGQVSRMD
ncbi:hypothetical protein BY996DRAFT_6500450 [Phakopsora pachyrhizi]|nr:hypothetical protein BY996DRAFT_6500450 [Phakopsora pachyrhizi]